MIFTELNIEEFTLFLDKHPLRTFFQRPEMDAISKMENKESYYVGVKDNNNNIIAASRLVSKIKRFNQKWFYASRGLLIDYHNKELLSFFTTELKKFIKTKNGYALHIDPMLEYVERDINGDEVKDGFNNHDVYEKLISLNYKHEGFIRHYDTSKQVRWGFVLPLENMTGDQIMSNMKGNTRRSINKSIEYGVKIKELNYDEIERFVKITDSTGERRSFSNHSLEYYKTMYKMFHDKGFIKYLIAEVDLDKTLITIDENIIETKRSLEKENIRKDERKAIEKNLESLEKRKIEITEMKDKHGTKLDLSAAMFMTYGDEVIYYYSGSYGEFMTLRGQYLIQWHMIEDAIKMGKKSYNFYGIKGNFDKKDPDYGVYEFKKGFTGHVTEYIGDFILPIKSYYYVEKTIQKIKQWRNK